MQCESESESESEEMLCSLPTGSGGRSTGLTRGAGGDSATGRVRQSQSHILP